VVNYRTPGRLSNFRAKGEAVLTNAAPHRNQIVNLCRSHRCRRNRSDTCQHRKQERVLRATRRSRALRTSNSPLSGVADRRRGIQSGALQNSSELAFRTSFHSHRRCIQRLAYEWKALFLSKLSERPGCCRRLLRLHQNVNGDET
jgi:hypothetical protein